MGNYSNIWNRKATAVPRGNSTELHLCVEGDGKIDSCIFLERAIGVSCLAKLLGVGTNRLRKGANLNPDLRYGKCKQGDTEKTHSVHAFLTTLYESVAETLLDR